LLDQEKRRKNNIVEAPQAEALLVRDEPNKRKVETKRNRKKKVQYDA
jgi:hypothetical protein